MKNFLTLFVIFLSITTINAQIVNGTDTLYGNEWINYAQSYYKISVSENGVYRLDNASLRASGIPLSNVAANRFRLYNRGREIPMFTTTEGIMASNDFVEFYGQKNRSELDVYTYSKGATQLLNPEYSNYTDTAVYYLTWQESPSTLRYTNQANILTSPPTAEAWFWHTEKKIFIESALKPGFNTDKVYLPEFLNGEGFGSIASQDFSTTITPQFKAEGQKSQLKIRWAGNYYELSTHITELSLNGAPLSKDTAINNTLQNKVFDLDSNQLKSSMSVRLLGTNSTNDLATVSNVSLKYARLFNFNNQNYFEFDISASTTDKLLEIENFNSDNQKPILLDVSNNIRIITTIENGKIKALLPPSVLDRKLILYTSNATKTNTLKSVTFVNLKESGGNYVMITGKTFLENPTTINEYAAYRTSNEGGNFKVQIVDAQQLYEQFGYGINRHPLAIRNFIKYIKKNWLPVSYIFLVGKGRDYQSSRTGVDFDVPTWGYPGSDILLAASNNSDVPDIAIGRIAASTTADLKIYLDKVKGHEYSQKNTPYTAEGRDWMKKILQLNGGGNESSQIKVYLDQFKNIAANNVWGAQSIYYAKDNVDPVQVSQNQLIYDRINKGVSLITFFGHSSFQVLAFEINNPDFFTNKDKYNAFLALGCIAGNCFNTIQGVSENFVLYPNKGSIAFMGTSGTAYLPACGLFGSTLYKNLTLNNYGKGFGDIIKATQDSLSRNRNDLGLRSVLQEFIYNGDPAIKINASLSPDVTPDAASIKLEPQVLNTQLDSFNLTFDIANIGKTSKDSMTVSIKQQLPNGSQIDLWKAKIVTPQYRQTLSLNLPLTNEQAIGENRLLIKVDADNNLDEQPAAYAETNNDLMTNGNMGYSFFITDNKVRAVYPNNFSIAGNKAIILKASSSITNAKPQNFTFEVDTVGTFNSPFKQRNVVNQIAGVIKWQPNIAWQEGKVYYWRVAQDSIKNVGYDWDNSSFIYLPQYTEGGWNQSHVNQFDKNQFDGLQFSKEKKGEFEFLDEVRGIEIKYEPNLARTDNPTIFYNSARALRNLGYPNAGLYVLVYPPTEFRRWFIPNFGIDGTSRVYNTVDPSALIGRKGFMDIIDSIPDNYQVYIFSVLQTDNADLGASNWANDSINFQKNIFSVLEKQGARQIRSLEKMKYTHYSVAFVKNKTLLAENLGNQIGANLSFDFTNKKLKGNMTSKLIGPSKEWKNLELNYKVQETTPVSDTIGFDIYGVSSDKKTDSLLLKNVKNTMDISNINPVKFPYLKLQFYAYDSIQRTSPQLNNWRVVYKGLPDLALNLNADYKFYNDTMQQGDKFALNVSVENLNDEATDSISLKYRVVDAANNEIVKFTKLPPFDKFGVQKTAFTYDTRTLKDQNTVVFEVNPGKTQAETNYFNNFYSKSFIIDKDKKNPLLDVTFDGIRILNNDIVSAKPNITINVKDDNKYLSLNDTSLFKLYIETTELKRIPIALNDPSVSFLPEKSLDGKNSIKIEYKPTFTVDGVYKLIVNATDASGNAAATNLQYEKTKVDYIVSFKVYTKSSISNVLPYPNPFSTSTRFAYTLTGATTPQYFKIQIMSVAGKVVREITQNEIGSLKIGTHLTDYAWDGKDEYGDQLANGVYLYRIVAKNENKKAFEYNEEIGKSTVDFFKEGFGKLVIMR
jgi:Peptidase family C25